MKTTLAFDNGVTGSLAIFGPNGTIFEPMPVKPQLMGKSGKVIKRIDHDALRAILLSHCPFNGDGKLLGECVAHVERPFTGGAMMVNVAVLSARAYESVIITLEQLGIGYSTQDSKSWQASMLGNIKGSANLKAASKLRGMEMFPQHAQAIKSHKDADSILMGKFYHEK